MHDPKDYGSGPASLMNLSDILPEATTDHALELLSPTAVAEIQSRIFVRGGRAYVRCLVRDTGVLAKPEEIIRQLWLYRLTTHYDYDLSRIAVEYPITFGRDNSKRADIVIFDRLRPTVPYAIIEVKRTCGTPSRA